MNDCLWAFMCDACSCEHCNGCKDYISVNSEKGRDLLDKYQKDVEEALQPVYEKWKKDKESGVYGRD